MRLYRQLLNDPSTAVRAYESIVAIEKRLGSGLSLASALRSDARVAALSAHERAKVLGAAREDWRRIRVGQADLLGPQLSKSLDELLAELVTADPCEATTSSEAGENVRPQFRSVADDFISHHSESLRDGAKLLAEALELRGRSCWVAPRNIPPGTDWNDAVVPAVEGCGEFILLMSHNARASRRVKGELQLAIERGKRVIAVAMDDVRPERFDIGLKTFQIIAWLRPLNDVAAASELAELILGELRRERDSIQR